MGYNSGCIVSEQDCKGQFGEYCEHCIESRRLTSEQEKDALEVLRTYTPERFAGAIQRHLKKMMAGLEGKYPGDR